MQQRGGFFLAPGSPERQLQLPSTSPPAPQVPGLPPVAIPTERPQVVQPAAAPALHHRPLVVHLP